MGKSADLGRMPFELNSFVCVTTNFIHLQIIEPELGFQEISSPKEA
jgi:hypothetical protein